MMMQRTQSRMLAAVLGGLTIATTFGRAQEKPPKAADDGTVIEDVTLISPGRAKPLPHTSVVIRDGRIVQIGALPAKVGPHATRIDGKGKFLIPGLIDSHVHVGATGMLEDESAEKHSELIEAYRAQLPRSFLAYGFTTVVDLDHNGSIAWFSEAPAHPNLYQCGRGVHVLGGYGAFRIPKDAAAADALNLVYQPTEAKDWPAALDPKDYTPARAVERAAAAGAICVKTFVEDGFNGVFHWPVPSAETLAALRAETKKRGLVFIVHANAVKNWHAAIDAHADVIAHGLWHWDGDRLNATPPPQASQVIAEAAKAGVKVQPTLQVIFGELSIFDRSLLNDPRFSEAVPHAVVAYLQGEEATNSARELENQYRQAFSRLFPASVDAATVMSVTPKRVTATLRLMEADQVKLLFGSDTPSAEGIGNPPGLNGRMELGRWFDAGIPLSQILRAATLDNAETFGLAKDLGTIEAGKRADLLLLREDPLKSIAAYDSIETVFVGGRPLKRSELLAK